MEIKIDPKVMDKATEDLTDLEKTQLPIAMARTINDTAADLQAAERREMEQVFDSPTPMTLNSIKVWKANKRTLTGRIFVRDEAAKGNPPVKYLRAQVEGGERRPKRFEMAMRIAGHLRSDGFLVPSKASPLNRYGNFTGGRITQFLDAIGANFKDSSQHSKTQGRRYFFGQPKGFGAKVGPGVWLRTKNGLKPMLLLRTKAPTYSKRFKFHEVADQVVSTRFLENFKKRMAEAVATAHLR
nr:hypothetical protein [uncultured Holophaga sp.]